MSARHLPGLLLIAIGAALLIVFQTDVGGEAIPGLIGLCFLVAYAATREYGLLVPGAILTGLGAGIVTARWTDYEGVVVLGLGLGFLAIALAPAPREGRWWPLIPGGILTVVGLAALRDAGGWIGAVAEWWPAALVVIGLWLVLRPGRRGDRENDHEEAEREPDLSRAPEDG